ncbi:MAG: nucleoside hydrolase [Alphaproteobacteria bacterium]
MKSSENKEQINIWIDADMGGDDAWLIVMAVGAARLDPRIKLHGLSTVFGNTDVENATNNARMLLTYLGVNDLPLYKGVGKPYDGSAVFGDDAYGEEGFCGVHLLEDTSNMPVQPLALGAHDGLAEALKNLDGKMTILSSGPATNIAHLIDAYPELIKEKVERLILMSGAVQPGPVPNPKGRVGNITYWAEFNAFQDPASLNVVFESGIPTEVIPLDVAHMMPLNAQRKAEFPEKFVQMTSFVETLDREKFGADGPTIHDPNILIWALCPELFSDVVGYDVCVDVSAADMADEENRRGWYRLNKNTQSAVKIIESIAAEDAVFAKWRELFDAGIVGAK